MNWQWSGMYRNYCRVLIVVDVVLLSMCDWRLLFLDFLLIDGHVLGMILMYLPYFVLLLVAMLLLVAGSNKIYGRLCGILKLLIYGPSLVLPIENRDVGG